MYKVYQLERNVSALLSLLSLCPERKVKCYNRYFVNGYVFHTEHGHSISSEFEVDYYGKFEEVVEL
jgi:hypothetical protein